MTDEMVMEYDTYIYSFMRYFEGYPNKEDLFQAGRMGLLMAYQKFDDSLGVKFTTYAYSSIYGEMCKLVREDKGIKISRDIIKLKLRIEKATVLLSQKLMRTPTTEELAMFLNIEEYKIIEAVKTIHLLQSIDEPIHQDGKEMTLHEVIGDHQVDMHTMLALKESIATLGPQERELLIKRYMEDMTQSEVAKQMGMSQVQVSRKEMKVKQKLYADMVA